MPLLENVLSDAMLNQEMADAGLRWPLASRAQLSKLVLDMFHQRRDKRWDGKSHHTVGPPLYAMRPQLVCMDTIR